MGLGGGDWSFAVGLKGEGEVKVKDEGVSQGISIADKQEFQIEH